MSYDMISIGIYDVEPEDCDFCVGHVEEDQGRNPPFFKMCKRHQAELGKVVTRLNMAGYGPQMQR